MCVCRAFQNGWMKCFMVILIVFRMVFKLLEKQRHFLSSRHFLLHSHRGFYFLLVGNVSLGFNAPVSQRHEALLYWPIEWKGRLDKSGHSKKLTA